MARTRVPLLKSLSVILPVAVALALGSFFLFSRPSPAQRFQAGLAALEQGDQTAVTQVIDHLSAVDGFERQVHLLQGGLHLRRGRVQAALDELAQTRPEGELREPALLLTGEALYRNGQLADAQSLFEMLIGEQPDHPQGHRWLAAIYYDLGALEQARAHLNTLSALRPDDFAPYWLSGQVQFDFEEYAKAAAAYRRALDRHPPADAENDIRVNLARALLKLREPAEALTALAPVQNAPTALALQAECHAGLGNLSGARERLQQALRQDPGNRDALLLQAQFAGDAGNLQQAVAALTRVLKSDPHNYEARYQLARAYGQQGQMDDYRREADRLETDRKLYDRLSQLSTQAIQRPDDAAIRHELADVCRQLEKHELAQMWHSAAQACQRRTAR